MNSKFITHIINVCVEIALGFILLIRGYIVRKITGVLILLVVILLNTNNLYADESTFIQFQYLSDDEIFLTIKNKDNDLNNNLSFMLGGDTKTIYLPMLTGTYDLYCRKTMDIEDTINKTINITEISSKSLL